MDAVFFDLDGTLLPMDQDEFVNGYFKLLAKKAAPRGYEPKPLLDAIWKGVAAMVRNDGSQSNEAAFWQTFAAIFGEAALADKGLFEEFYRVEFQAAKAFCGYAPQAAALVRDLKARGFRVVLATNPIFPKVATEHRIRWAGLDLADFELYTTYENSHYSKPDVQYFTEILQKTGLDPARCLMVGNDVDEDMVAATLGMKVFLLTDCLINRQQRDISVYPHGGFDRLAACLAALEP